MSHDEWLDSNYPAPRKTQEEIERDNIESAKRAADFVQAQKEESLRAEAERKTIMANDDGVVSICPEHGRYFHEYDFKKEKVMNHEIKCPVCGNRGQIVGSFRLEIPERSHEWEY